MNLLKTVIFSFSLFALIDLDAQNEESVKKYGKIIFRQYLNGEVDSILNNYYPNEKAHNWFFEQWKIDTPNYIETKTQVQNWLKENLNSSEEHRLNLNNVTINNTKYIPSDIHKLGGDNLINVEKLEVYFTDGNREYIGLVVFFEFENKLWLYLEGGLQFRIKED